MYYLYIYFDSRKPGRYTYGNFVSFLHEPFYVGKGKGNRAYDHLKEVNHTKTKSSHKTNKIKRIVQSNNLPSIAILETGTADYILHLEETYINAIGRTVDNTGPLTNIRANGWETTEKSTTRRSNGCKGRRQSTVTDGIRNFRCNDQDLDAWLAAGYRVVLWKRPKRSSTMSRTGTSNPMYGKSAVKGRKWVTLDDGSVLFLSLDQISQLSDNFVYGRIVDKNKRKRIIVRDAPQSRYMTDSEISALPSGTQYQVGLMWKITKETFTIQ